MITPYLMLAALTWAVASRGGTGLRDLAIVLGLLVVAILVARAWPRRDGVLWASFAALMGWLTIGGALRTGPTLEAFRVPLLVAIAACAVLVVRAMTSGERDALVKGIVVIGCIQSAITLIELVLTVSSQPSVPPRPAALLGSPDGLGMLLVVTAVLTARELKRHRRGRLPTALLLLQSGAILATGSRTAAFIAAVLMIGYVTTHADWKRGTLAAAGLVAAMAVVIWRTANEPHQDRPDLWQEALRRIAAQPLTGKGPPPAPFTPAVPGARITTNAHNELLQWALEYGLIGLALALVVVVLAFRNVHSHAGGDPWFRSAALALVFSGLTDFTLRITALTLAAAALAALAVPQQRAANLVHTRPA